MVTEQLHEAAGELVAALSAANLYFADQAPWGKKDDMARMGAILATTADVLRRAAIAALAVRADGGGQDARPARGACRRAAAASMRSTRTSAIAPQTHIAGAGAGVQEVRAGEGGLTC